MLSCETGCLEANTAIQDVTVSGIRDMGGSLSSVYLAWRLVGRNYLSKIGHHDRFILAKCLVYVRLYTPRLVLNSLCLDLLYCVFLYSICAAIFVVDFVRI